VPRRRASLLVADARHRAKAKGLACTLIVPEITKRIQLGHCEATGLSFSLLPSNTTLANPFAPSLDRRDPLKGYTPDNVRVVVCAFNFAKGEWPVEIFETVARAYLARHNQ
jgi:hypothetical protein